MRGVTLRRRPFLLAGIALSLVLVSWFYWNRPARTDLSSYAPADALAFIEVNDLAEIANGVIETRAWQSLAGPIGAPASLTPSRWLIRLARWTGVGSTDTILFARSQVAIVFSGAEGTQAGSTLVIKPLTTFVIETHTSQRRMRATVEHHIEELAQRLYQNPVFVRKQIAGRDFQEWQSADGAHTIVFAFADTAVVVGNDETSVLHSLEARAGGRASLKDQSELAAARQSHEAGASLFGYVTQTGAKSLLQAFALYRSGPSADAVTGARIFSDTIGGLIKSISWTARFAGGGVEDHFSVALADGVADKLRASMVPDRGPDVTRFSFIPKDFYSLSLYQFRDANSFWGDLNATMSAHTDLIGAVAARPMLRALVKPYGIDDADTFARAIGPRIQTVRLEQDSPAVLITEVFDRQALRKAILQKFGQNPKNESVGDAELILSNDNWAAGFVDNSFLIGPTESVRQCLNARMSTASDRLRQSQASIDVSLPLTSIFFSDDRQSATSFVEAFSNQDRPAFAGEASAIDAAAGSLPFAVSVSLLKGQAIDWTSRSSFGVLGALATELMPSSTSK
jgi:hypothetical protein